MGKKEGIFDRLFGDADKKDVKKTKSKKTVKGQRPISPPVDKVKREIPVTIIIPETKEERLESEALDREIKSEFKKNDRGLSIRELKFIKYHLLGLFNDLAAQKAGYSKKSSAAIACTLLKRPNVIKEIKRRVKGIVKRADEKIAYAIENLQIDAYYLALDVVDEYGALRPREELGVYERVIRGIETKKNAKGDEYTIVKLANKDKAREQLGRYYQMFTDKIELSGGLELTIGKPPEPGSLPDEPSAETTLNVEPAPN